MTQTARAVFCACAASAALLACVDRAGVAITSPPDGSTDGSLGDSDVSSGDAPSGDGAPLLQLPPMHAIHGNNRLICAAGEGAIYLKRPDEPWSAVILPSRSEQSEIEQISWRGVFCPSAHEIIAVGFNAADMVPTGGRVIELAVPLAAEPTAQILSFESILEAVHGTTTGDIVVAVGAIVGSVGETEAGVVTRLTIASKVVWNAVLIGDMPTHQGLRGVWVTETQEQIVVGNGGVVLQRQGAEAWSTIPPNWPSRDLQAVWSESNGKTAFVVGRGTLLQREGSVWTGSTDLGANWNGVYGKEDTGPIPVAVGEHALAISNGSGWNTLTEVAGLDLPNSNLRGVWISESTERAYVVGNYNDPDIGGSDSGLLAECNGLADADASFAPTCTLLSRP